MNENVLTVEEAARCLAELVERVHAQGEAVLLVKSGHPLARVVSVPAAGQGTEELIAFLRQWRSEHPEPDDQFAEIIEESRRGIQPPRDPGQ